VCYISAIPIDGRARVLGLGWGICCLGMIFFYFASTNKLIVFLFKVKPQRTPKNKEHMGSLTLLEAY
jgi:hypothetical protein